MEVFSVGPEWEPEKGKLGAIWAAQRVPDDHIAIVPNWSIIKEIDLNNPDYFLASSILFFPPVSFRECQPEYLIPGIIAWFPPFV